VLAPPFPLKKPCPTSPALCLGTGITAENFSQSILAQFELTFKLIRIPFTDSVDKALVAVQTINEAFQRDQVQPIVFTTLVNTELNGIVSKAQGLVLDMFQTFVARPMP
jgi:regulator of PEP synthase PpsR (kinase-PPPase family)